MCFQMQFIHFGKMAKLNIKHSHSRTSLFQSHQHVTITSMIHQYFAILIMGYVIVSFHKKNEGEIVIKVMPIQCR